MNGLRLYFFSCGRLYCDPAIYLPDQPRGQRVACPMPFYLLVHPKGLVLVDTGVHPLVAQEPEAAWGGLTKAFYPEVSPSDLAPAQIQRAGFDPDSIETVICTHLHMDHAGGNSLFERARFLVHPDERRHVANPALEGQGYFRRDWDHPLTYTDVADGYDVFGDGSVTMHSLRGHSPGHMGLVVKLPRSGTVVLGIDAAPMAGNIDGRLPQNVWNREQAEESVQWLREMRAAGARIVCGHDPAFWDDLPLAPAYLD